MKKDYDPHQIEQDAQQTWETQQSFEVKEDLSKEKFYCLSMLPYPSGELHMGHVRNYTIGDVIARLQRMKGKNVLQPMGWDAFGLPAENAALEHKLAPSKWTYKNIEQMRGQLKRLGFAFDWKREFATCMPEYYAWEQWLFLRMYKKGLVYKKNAMLNWDPVDQTVLANEQVIDGRGWRSGAVVERREISQWFLKITDYAEELLNSIDTLKEWPDQVRQMQRNWIGRSEGINIHFDVAECDATLSVFTTRPDTLMGATYVAIAAEHNIAKQAATQNKTVANFINECRKIKVAEAELATMEKVGVDTGRFAIHPITGDKLPIWAANFVLMEYGAGAVMSVPAHDQRDFEFAQQYKLPIKPVIKPNAKETWDYSKSAFIEKGTLIDSAQFTHLTSEKAFDAIADYLAEQKKGERQVHYRLRDWGISRQRYWGAPIPIVNCSNCGTVPVPEKELPVVLPEDVILKDPGSPLAKIPDFYETKCPCCGRDATRETDTFDTFMESSWYYARYTCPDQHKAMLDDRAKYWTPVNQYIGGIEHAIMHLLYARFIHKVLRDEGLLNCDEPFLRLLTQGMVLKDGVKMSKSKGNTVSPDALIKKYGADTARLFAIFAAPPEQSLEWSDSGVEGAHRFLKRLWEFAYTHHETLNQLNENKPAAIDWETAAPEQQKLRRNIHQILQQANRDVERLQLNTIVSACMKLLNELQPVSTKNDIDAVLLHEGFSILLRLLAPIAPHITHALWQALGYENDILNASWPKVQADALKTDTIVMVVQVNGKLRSKITVPADADKETIQQIALADEKVKQFTEPKTIKKIIVVPKKLINLVVN